MTTPVNQPPSGQVPTPQPGAAPTDADVNALASQIKAMVDAASAGSVQLSQALVAATALTATPPTVSVTLSGSAVQIDGVSFMEGYTPAVGDNVDVLKQGNAIVVIGHVADTGSATETTAGWVATSITGISYRKVLDNGQFKVQFMGQGTATGATLFTLPTGFRPLVTKERTVTLANYGACNLVITSGGVCSLTANNTSTSTSSTHSHGIFRSLIGYLSQAGSDLGHSHDGSGAADLGGGATDVGGAHTHTLGSLVFSNTIYLDEVGFFI